MIVVELVGGLGNQLFQYAAGRRLALLHQCPLTLDLGWFSNVPPDHTPRRYELDPFAIDASTAPPRLLDGLAQRVRRRHRARGVADPRPWYEQSEIVERMPFRADPDFLRIAPPARLVGFWQSHRYCEPIRAELVRELSLVRPLSPPAQALAVRIRARPSVGVHVRRGDYVARPETTAFHGVCSARYYADAMSELARRVDDPSCFVFSDEPAWCREHLDLGTEIEVVEGNPAHEELHLMALCRHHVIANSSFSWWAAWLGARPGQVVIAPHPWVLVDGLREANPCPPGWLLLAA